MKQQQHTDVFVNSIVFYCLFSYCYSVFKGGLELSPNFIKETTNVSGMGESGAGTAVYNF